MVINLVVPAVKNVSIRLPQIFAIPSDVFSNLADLSPVMLASSLVSVFFFFFFLPLAEVLDSLSHLSQNIGISEIRHSHLQQSL